MHYKCALLGKDMKEDTIKTFLVTAGMSSFSKASKTLYLTPNAVKKRIESFEKELGISLFVRTNRGVHLTKAGDALYKDLLRLEKQYARAVRHARDIAHDESGRLHIGMSDTFSDIFLSSNWLDSKNSRRSMHLIRYGNTIHDIDQLFLDVGYETDIVIDICDQNIADKYGLKMVKISEFSCYMGLPVLLDDEMERNDFINHKTVDVLYRGRSSVTDAMIDYITCHYPDAKLREINNYHFWTIQESFEKGNCIFVAGDLKRLFPNYHFYKMGIDQKVSFGIYYRNINNQIQAFVDMLKEH